MNITHLRCALALGIAVLLYATSPPAHSAGLGPIFPLPGGTQIAAKPNGTIVLVETFTYCVEPAHVLYREVRSAQIPFGGTNQFAWQFRSDVTSPGCRFPAFNSDIAVNATNEVVTYADKSVVIPGEPHAYDVAYSFLGVDGVPGEPSFAMRETRSWHDYAVAPRIAMNAAGQFAIVWFYELENTSSFALASLFDPSGAPINTNGPITLNQGHNAYAPVVGIAADGRTVYAWDDATVAKYGFAAGTGIYARLADSNGVPIGSEFQVNTTTNAALSQASVAMDVDGSFVIAWALSGGVNDGIYLQRFDEAGNKLGAEERVSRRGTAPRIAMAPDGRFVVVWEGEDGDGNGIFAQRFLAEGTRVGRELWVNEGATNSQTTPLLALTTNGTFFVKWTEAGNHFARWIPWDASNQTNILGPWIQSVSPTPAAPAPLTNIVVTFDREMNTNTFTDTAVQLVDPVGRLGSISSIQSSNGRVFTVAFAPQNLRGLYEMKIGPNIADPAGSLMDQNANGTKGEAADAFQTTIMLAATKTTIPFFQDFESGSVDALGSHWSFLRESSQGLSVAATESSIRNGSNTLVMVLGGSATLNFSLAGATNLTLDFDAKQTERYYGYFGNADVAISGDGKTWHSISQPWAYLQDWRHFSVKLDGALQTNGLTGSSNLQIRFQNGSWYYAPQVWHWDNIRVTTNADVFGPRLELHSPTGALAGPISSCTVTFNEAMDASTFTDADVQVFAPTASLIPLSSNLPVVALGDGRSFQINFAVPQVLAGTYTLKVGPHIADISGNELDQNGDGEAPDVYTGTFSIMPGPAAPAPVHETFEVGTLEALGSNWSFDTTGGGAIYLAQIGWSCSDGTNSLALANGGSAVMRVNLAGATNVTLEFCVAQTEPWHGHYADGEVSISPDGTNWALATNIFAYTHGWRHFSLDLDSTMRAAGFAYSTNFLLRFSAASWLTQNWFWDNIRVTPDVSNRSTLSAPMQTVEGAQLQLRGPAGRTFIVESSANLDAWIPILTNSLPPNGTLDVLDANALNAPIRFYRARLVP